LRNFTFNELLRVKIHPRVWPVHAFDESLRKKSQSER